LAAPRFGWEASVTATRRGRLLRFGLILAVVGGAAAFVVSRIDFGETVKEFTLPLRHDDIIRQQADRFELDAALIAAIINQESGFVDQTSSAGARGLMQITPDTAETIENLSGGETFVFEDLANPDLNIRYGTFYLNHLLDRFQGNEIAALAAYNGGPENAESWGGVALELDDIEFPETRSYVESVLEKRRQYTVSYSKELGID
jgi:soluble lytic murein transglycosylase